MGRLRKQTGHGKSEERELACSFFAFFMSGVVLQTQRAISCKQTTTILAKHGRWRANHKIRRKNLKSGGSVRGEIVSSIAKERPPPAPHTPRSEAK